MRQAAARTRLIGTGLIGFAAALLVAGCASTVAGQPAPAGGGAPTGAGTQNSNPSTAATSDDPAPSAGPEDTDVFSLEVGDCLAQSDEVDESDEVSTVPVVPCTQEHDGQIYAATDLPDGDFPGTESVRDQADDLCAGKFDAFVGLSYDESVLDFYPFYPTEESWGGGDREVLCVAFDPAGPVTGPLENAGR